MTQTAIHNVGPDKKLDEFLEGLTTLVADAVEKGIKAALSEQLGGGGPRAKDDLQNRSSGRLESFRSSGSAVADGFKPPKAD